MSALRKLKRRFVLETRSDDNFIKTAVSRREGPPRGPARYLARDRLWLSADDANFTRQEISGPSYRACGFSGRILFYDIAEGERERDKRLRQELVASRISFSFWLVALARATGVFFFFFFFFLLFALPTHHAFHVLCSSRCTSVPLRPNASVPLCQDTIVA